jgi:chemotaxis protein histidine kinase CheA
MTSGRGMGMDIVKSKVEQMNGNIRIETKENQFCMFTIEFSNVA